VRGAVDEKTDKEKAMSVVACKILPGGFEIAADSLSVHGYTKTKNNVRFSKLFEVDGLVIGGVGLPEDMALLELFAMTHKPAEPTERAVLEFWSEFADWKRKKTDIDSAFLIGLDDRVFLLDAWLITQVLTFEAIGEGMDFARAALYLGHDAEKAVETAIELNVWCDSPVRVIRKPARRKP
jgi:hypothetical protein